jgi:hypothetical protein
LGQNTQLLGIRLYYGILSRKCKQAIEMFLHEHFVATEKTRHLDKWHKTPLSAAAKLLPSISIQFFKCPVKNAG